MINFVLNNNDSSEIFKNQAYRREGVVFAPKLVHTGSFTIESYLEFGKTNFEFESIAALYELFELPKTTTRLFDLEFEQLMLIHYWSHLLVDSQHTILDIPDVEFSEQFMQALKLLLAHYNRREITIITTDKRLIEVLKQLDGTKKKLLPTYKFKMRRIEIANMFISEKLLVFAALVTAMIIILFSVAIDNRLVGDYENYLAAPDNLIFVDNTTSDCSFNQVAYDLPASSCFESEPISYARLLDLLNLEQVDRIIFDDAYNTQQLETKIESGEQPTASVPDFDYGLQTTQFAIPCLNPETTPEPITCGEYNPDNSLISIATSEDSSQLERNIAFNQATTISPQYIFIETSDPELIASTLATSYPDINVYSHQATETYISKTNHKLLVNAVLSGTLFSIVSALLLNLLLSQFKLYIRGHKYLLSYLTKRPLRVHRIFYLSQLCFFGFIFAIGSVTAFNLVTSFAGFMLSTYLGLLNIALWIFFSDINGVEFRIENKKLYNCLRDK